MSNDAEHLESLLAEYVDGQLDASSAKLVEEHLAKNPATRAAVEQMKLDREAVRSLPRVTAPADMAEDLRGRLERDLLLNIDPIGAQKSRRFSPSVAAIAAMLVICLGLASIGYVLLGNRPKPYLDVAIREPVSTTPASPELTKADDDEAKQKLLAAGDAKPDAAMKSPRTMATQDRAIALPRPQEETVAQPMASIATETPANVPPEAAANESVAPAASVPAEKIEAAPSTAAVDAAAVPADAAPGALPGGEPARTEVVGGTPMKPAIVAVVPAPIPQQQTLAVSDEILPADAAAAIVGRSLDPARRSIVVVVDSAHALDAFAFATRFAKDDNAIEVTDVGQQLTSFSRERAGRRDMHAGAALAVVARGLAESSASSIQSELRRVDPVEGAAFEVTPVQTPLDFQQGLLTDAATTRPASAGQAGPATTQHAVTPTTAPVLDQAKPSDAAQLIDLYVVVRQATPETQPTSQPTTQPMH